MAPHIGITCDLDDQRTTNTLPRAYVRAVMRAGGIPRVLPIPEMEHTPGGFTPGNGLGEDWGEWLSGLDGLLLSGGGDLDPALFGEEPLPGLGGVDLHRDALEMALARAARRRNGAARRDQPGCRAGTSVVGADGVRRHSAGMAATAQIVNAA